MTVRVVVLMTAHNRRATTVACLERLRDQRPCDADIRVVLVDDASTDGTARAAARVGLPLQVIRGPGDLYWAGGMQWADMAAVRQAPDAFVWLNDDVLLDQDAVLRMLAVAAQYPEAIVVGATRSSVDSSLTYGGRRRASTWHPQRFELLPLSDRVQTADTFNGNVVLVPMGVRQLVGPIDGRFPHAYADDDYGLRARQHDVQILQAPGTVGVCERNQQVAPIRGLRSWRTAQASKGTPLAAQIRFFRRHGGRAWPLILFGQQVRQMLPAGHGSRAEDVQDGLSEETT